jgi:hypothetical protein
MRNAAKMGVTHSHPKRSYEERLIAIGDSLSDNVCFDNTEDWENDDHHNDNTELGNLSEYDKPS